MEETITRDDGSTFTVTRPDPEPVDKTVRVREKHKDDTTSNAFIAWKDRRQERREERQKQKEKEVYKQNVAATEYIERGSYENAKKENPGDTISAVSTKGLKATSRYNKVTRQWEKIED